MKRRSFLKAGGAMLALPLLESGTRADEQLPVYTLFMRQANGVTQGDSGGEEDRFWPREPGALTRSGLEQQSERVVSELAPWADQLLMVKGLDYAFGPTGCGHASGGNQCLTAARPSEVPDGAGALAMGESVDNFIARHFHNNGGEPLTLYCGRRSNYLEEVLSYRGALQLRAAEDDPWLAYQRMVGLDGGALDELVMARRMSVNDLLLDQIHDLLNQPRLSSADRQRLQLHFDSVREFELLSCRFSEDEEQAMALVQGQGILDDNRLLVARMHLDLAALAFACDFARSATLQIGDGNDGTEYTVNGQRLPRFHWVSHRIYSDGAEGEAIEGAEDMHHQIDRLMAQTFGHLLTRLQEHELLQQSAVVWCSDLGNGVSHSFRDVPFIIAGGASGALRTGQFVDAGGVTHNKLFNTLIHAAGVRDESGGPIEDFGDASLEGGVLDALLA